jgi:hypothetical protein
MEATMKYMLMLAVIALIAMPAWADQTLCYSWEDGGTVLGHYPNNGNACCETNVTGPQTGLTGDVAPGTWTCTGAYDGDRYLHVAEDPHTGTPQFYVAWITGLLEGDNVAASFYGWDSLDRVSTNGEPAIRIWGHYTGPDDIEDYGASAGEGNSNSGYTTAVGWQMVSSDWTITGYSALCIEFRVYSYATTADPDHTDYWADLVCVTAPDHATIHFPEPFSPVEESTWGTIKALYR